MTTVREWKPGDVAVMPDGGRAIVAVADAWKRRFVHEDGQWRHGDARNGIAPRPLAVIDFEDREQVERLVTAYAKQRRLINGEDVTRTDDMQAALREFADPKPPKPPKPKEPTAMWSVVVDTADEHWVRVLGSDFTDGWVRAGSLPSNGKWTDYRDIDAVKVLSDGIPA